MACGQTSQATRLAAGKCPVFSNHGAFPGSKFSGEYTVNLVKKLSIARKITENPQKNRKLTVNI